MRYHNQQHRNIFYIILCIISLTVSIAGSTMDSNYSQSATVINSNTDATKFPFQPSDEMLESKLIVVISYICIFFDLFNILNCVFNVVIYFNTKTSIHIHFKVVCCHVVLFLIFRSVVVFFPNFYYVTKRSLIGKPSTEVFNVIYQVAVFGGYYAPLTIIEERIISALCSKTYERWFSKKIMFVLCAQPVSLVNTVNLLETVNMIFGKIIIVEIFHIFICSQN